MANLLLAVIYLAFVSLGLPDALLGAAWPVMTREFDVPVSWQAGISMVISAGTIVSALLSDRMTLRFGAGRVTAVSVAMTALALAGFSFAPGFPVLVLLAIPYGLGAGGVDAALNNYVAVHYESRHMSWLHCMWGLGASLGPYIMGYALSGGHGWHWGYRCVAGIQAALTCLLILSLPLWKRRRVQAGDREAGPQADGPEAGRKPLGIRGVLAIRGAKEILVMFFCYCALEQTAMLWSSSYMAMGRGIGNTVAASWAALFLIGVTAGRFLSGFMTMRFDDATMIRIGQALILAGIVTLVLPLPAHLDLIGGLMLIGLGCAPIYPCVIHATPAYFGEDKSQAIVGVQMACAYVGTLVMPPLFGLLAQYVSIRLFPGYLLAILALMTVMHERLRRLRGDALAARP